MPDEGQQARRSAGDTRLRVRAVTAIGALVALEVLAVLATRRAWDALRSPGPASLEEAVLLVVLAAGALVAGWWATSTVLAVAAHLPGQVGAAAHRWSRAWAPAATRRVAAVLVGAAVGGTMSSGALAASPGGTTPQATVASARSVSPSPPASRTAPPGAASGALSPGWTPARPTGTPAPVARLLTSGPATPVAEVVVHRGDSLWSIARRHLGPGATDAEVAAAWPHWHAANRDVIGADPDVLLPGQVLRAPDPAVARGHSTGASR